MNTEKFWLQEALHSFNLDTPNWYSWRTHDDNGNKIPNNERMCLEHVIVIKEGAIKPSKKQLEDRIKQLKNKSEFDYNRSSEYGTWQDQLDEIYHKGLDSWKARIQSIKQKYPK